MAMDASKAKLAAKIGAPLVLGSAALIAAMTQWEGQVLHVYADGLAGGLPTFCAGRTSWAEKIGRVFTKDQCDAIDRGTAIEYGQAVLDCTNHQFIDQNSLDALTLFAINVGKRGACTSRAVRLINAGNIKEGCKALAVAPDGKPVWSYASGRFVQGLANRRAFEQNWCLSLAKPKGFE